MDEKFSTWWSRVYGEVETHTTYYMWNEDDVLLYVGVAVRLRDRMKQHYKEKSWIQEVAHITTNDHSTRGAALKEEATAIRELEPTYNVAGSSSYKPSNMTPLEPPEINAFLESVGSIGLRKSCRTFRVSEDRGRRLLAGYGHP